MSTGSVVQGTVKGLGKEIGTSGLAVGETILFTNGTPDAKVTGQIGSDIAFDVDNAQFYMCEAAEGTDWIKLGSVS